MYGSITCTNTIHDWTPLHNEYGTYGKQIIESTMCGEWGWLGGGLLFSIFGFNSYHR